MLKRLAIVGVIVAALAVAPAAQALPLLVGGMSLSSFGAGAGLTPLVPVNAAGLVLVSYIGATALDFTTTGSATPGVAGEFKVDSTAGNFNALYGMTGTIKDFTFSGGAQANYPVPPITGFEMITSPVFSFDLQSVAVLGAPSANLLTLTGTGLFHLVGYADTPGSFYFSANEAGGTFSYSASEAAVPEPGSMMLLGTGLFGLAGVIRRRGVKK
jgi:hypothetical protein